MYNDMFWSPNERTIKNDFEYFKNTNYPEFRFKIDWVNFPEVEDYLMRLMLDSFVNSPNVREKLPELIGEVEDFFVAGLRKKIFTKENLNRIITSLSNPTTGFRTIEFLPAGSEGILSACEGTKIYINGAMPEHKNSPYLTGSERMRLHLYHEMGNKILNISSNEKAIDDFTSTIGNILASKGLVGVNLEGMEYVQEGFTMIEDCLAEELAEILTYSISKKFRPLYEQRIDLNCLISTNHDFYGIFQKPTISLGRAISGCAKDTTSDDEVLLNMIKKALNTNFDLDLIKEFGDDDTGTLYHDLFLILREMGLLKVQKYASFGYGTPLNINVNEILKTIQELTHKNKCTIDFPTDGYPNIDFDSFKTTSDKHYNL